MKTSARVSRQSPVFPEELGTLAAALLAVATGVAVGFNARSATLGVFWGIGASYVARGLAGIGPDWPRGTPGSQLAFERRAIVATLATAAAAGTLAMATAGWGRSWEAVALSLLVGGFVHAGALWVVVPKRKVRALLDGADVEVHPGDAAPLAVAMLSAVVAVGAVSVSLLVHSPIWDGVMGVLAGISIVSFAGGLWTHFNLRHR